MSSISNVTKNTLGYTMTLSNETVSRLIPGINFGGSTTPEIGPSQAVIFDALSATLRAFSTGTLGATGRWINEREVTF